MSFADQKSKKDLVVLLHGILRSKTDMLPLSKYLQKRGYYTANILYPSRKMDIESLSDYVAEQIENNPHYNKNAKLHFVVHSMGGLISRYYIEHKKPENLGNVVMLSPPNTGSEFADNLKENRYLSKTYEKIFGPAGQQLSTDYAHPDTKITYPLGVIAGTRSINPLAWFFLPKGAHDGIVPVERTKIEGMRDHIEMPVTHTFMMFNPKVMQQVHHFLKHSEFLKN